MYYSCEEFRDIPSGCYLHLPPGEKCCKEIACDTQPTPSPVQVNADLLQITPITNPNPNEIHTTVKRMNTVLSEAHDEIRRQYKLAMSRYEKMINNMKVSSDLDTQRTVPPVQYKVEPTEKTKLVSVKPVDQKNILSSYFSKYGPMFAPSKNQKRERRNLGNAKEPVQRTTRYRNTELSQTLEITDYLLEHRAKQLQQANRQSLITHNQGKEKPPGVSRQVKPVLRQTQPMPRQIPQRKQQKLHLQTQKPGRSQGIPRVIQKRQSRRIQRKKGNIGLPSIFR